MKNTIISWSILLCSILLITYINLTINSIQSTATIIKDFGVLPEEEEKQRNTTEEAQRCHRYGFNYNETIALRTPKRRIFVGSPIGDDAWNTINIVASEGYGLYHTVSFIESDALFNLAKRDMRFQPKSKNHDRLTSSNLYGPKTKVHVDYFLNAPEHLFQEPWEPYVPGIIRQNIQRELIIKRWKMNGMTTKDIGIIQDADETFTRDFLLAAQTCDIPQFRPGQNCKDPKIIASSLVFESSPTCIAKAFGLHKPDMIVGECIEGIGNNTAHPLIRRGAMNGTAGSRPIGHGGELYRDGNSYPGVKVLYNESLYPPSNQNNGDGETKYPLWNAFDYRMSPGGRQFKEENPIYDYKKIQKETGQDTRHTGYHFHNFFDDTDTIVRKYTNHAEYKRTILGYEKNSSSSSSNVRKVPLEKLDDDLKMSVECILQRKSTTRRLYIKGDDTDGVDAYRKLVGEKPIYFTDSYVRARQEQYKQMVLEAIG